MRRFAALTRALLPHICLLCDQVCPPDASSDLCRYCRRSLPWNELCCQRCALPMARSSAATVCRNCRLRPPAYTRCVAPLLYTDHPRMWVRRLKFRGGLVEARLLATLLAEALGEAYADAALPDVLIPVPLTLRRLAVRGHNQALALATVVGRRLRRPVNRTRVRRIRHTPAQRTLSRRARRNNLAGAFASGPWSGECLAIIDDVMTTGATTEALTHTLLEAGASQVHVWCATRTPAPP